MLNVEIHTPSKTLLSGQADQVIAPATLGEVGILPQHTEFLSTLKEGDLKVRQGLSIQEFKITGGLCSVNSNQVIVLVDGLQE